MGVVVLAAGLSVARADDSALARARVALAELRYEESNRLLDDALRAGGNTAEQVVEIYRLHGEVLAALGRASDAILKFERLLLLAPETRLADGVSPKISEPFQAAQQSTASLQPLRIRCAVNRAEPTTVAVVAEADPLAMVAGVEVVYRTRDGRRATAEPAGEATELVVLEPHTRPLWVAVVDEHGNRLRTRDIPSCRDITEASDQVRVRPPAGRSPRDQPPAPRFYARWTVWAGVAVGVGALATYFGLEANSAFDEIERMHADSESYEYVAARSVEQRAERNALAANISFAVAGAAAITAVVLMWRSRSARRSTMIAPTGGGDSLGLVMTVPF